MTKIPKRQLYKNFLILFLCILYISASLLFLFQFKIPVLKITLILFLPLLLLAFYLNHTYYRKRVYFSLKSQKIEEEINLTRLNLNRDTTTALSLKQRITTYRSLKSLVEKLNQQWKLENLTNILLDALFSLIAEEKGSCILYLVNPATQRLGIFATRRFPSNLIIKAKEGDLFDLWVIRHTCSLLVEDARNDFRFDFGTLQKTSQRTILSLVSSPLISQERLLGIIRVDSPSAHTYNQEDLRLLDTIADFSSLAIENILLFERVKELAIKDSLTSCFTKGYLSEVIKEEFYKAIKENKPLSLLMLDIDHFKDYNDKFGHIAGDIVLREIGELLNKIGETKRGMVFRFGGEEFCILLPHTDKQTAIQIAEDILDKVRRKEILLRRQKTSVTVSIGLISVPEDTILEDEIIFKADQCLYRAKQRGRDRLCYI